MLAVTLLPATLGAQGTLAGAPESGVGPVYETWRFGGDGILQPTVGGVSAVRVTRASQWSIPLAVTVPMGRRWQFDVTGAYARGTVELADIDSTVGADRYELQGVTDVRLRATGRLVGDNVLLTVGLNAPAGQTSLNQGELSALRVLAAPALSFQAPVLGTGASGTVGLVLAREIAGWAWAVGTSYEVRNKYTPIAVTAGLPVDLSPGNAMHVSAGVDGLVGPHGMTLGLSADFFGRDRLSLVAGAGADGPPGATSQLGPILTADWQLHVAAARFRELTVYVVDRYRTPYERDGRRLPGSSGNYLDAGFRAVAAMTPSTGALVALNGRHHTGLSSDETFTTAATRAAALTLGIVHDVTRDYSLQPFVRAQAGRLTSGSSSAGVTGLSGGVTLRARF
jgi:hypothetical protein